MKLIHVVLFTVVIGIMVAISAFVTYGDVKPLPVARFIDVSMLGEGELFDEIPVIRLGYSATITLAVEKLSSAPIKDILKMENFF